MVLEKHETDVKFPPVFPAGRAAGHERPRHAVPQLGHGHAGGASDRKAERGTHARHRIQEAATDPELGLGTTAQDVPFHCSTRAPNPVPRFCPPTAIQKEDDVQETSYNWLEPDPDGAFVLDHCVAPTVGGLLRAPGEGGCEDPTAPPVNATVQPPWPSGNVPEPHAWPLECPQLGRRGA